MKIRIICVKKNLIIRFSLPFSWENPLKWIYSNSSYAAGEVKIITVLGISFLRM